MRNLGPILTRQQYKGEIQAIDSFTQKRVCVINLINTDNKVIADHVWLDNGQWFDGLHIRDHFTFTAVPVKYIKTNKNSTNELEVDVKLVEIKDVKRVSWRFMFKPRKESGKKEEP